MNPLNVPANLVSLFMRRRRLKSVIACLIAEFFEAALVKAINSRNAPSGMSTAVFMSF
jgi:hypothetical protein